MNRLLAASLVLLATLVFGGCGGDAAATGANSAKAPAAKPLPSEYRVVAQALAHEMHTSPKGFKDNFTPSETLAGLHGVVIDLNGVKSDDPDITYLAAQGREAIAESVSRIERIAALPKPPSQGQLFVESFVHGWYGNFVTPYLNGSDATEKQKAIIDEVQGMMAAIDKVYATSNLLPKVAQKYAAPATDANGRIVVDIDEPWAGPYDWFSVCNTGAPLEDCTVQVELTGSSGETQQNVHFIKSWPTNTWMYGRYEAGADLLGRTFGRTTVPQIEKAEVTLWSPRFSTALTYHYSGPEKDKDYASRCQELKFTGKYQPHARGLLWNTQRGAEFTMEGQPRIPKCRVHVFFRRGLQSEGWYWDFDQWKQGEKKVFTTNKGQLTFDPDTIDMTISFPGESSYKHKVTLKTQ